MATLSSSGPIRATTIRGVDIPGASASETFTVPDDLAEEVQAALEARPDAPTITIHGYDRPPLLLVSNIPPFAPTTGIGVSTASTAHFWGLTVPVKVSVATAFFRVTAQAGNMDVGIYQASGSTLTRLTSTGAIAVPATGIGSQNAAALTSSVTLYPGVKYYAAIVADNTTAAFSGASLAGLPSISGYPGWRPSKASTYPLPTSVTIDDNNLAAGIFVAFG